MRFHGRVALVTGGSRGIGRAVAEGLAAEGARVMIGYKENRNAADGTVRSLTERGLDAVCHQVDVADPASVSAIVTETMRRFGAIDILVNSAGIVHRRKLAEVTPAEWEQVVKVNLTGTFLMMQAVLPHMAAREYGRIVNLASIAGRTGGKTAPHYAASKGGVIALTAFVAREYASMKITANCLAPDMTETDMLEGLDLGPLKEAAIAASPLGRMASPGEVAAAALFLASTEASYVNGECLSLTAGR